jgi:hypothetical protein
MHLLRLDGTIAVTLGHAAESNANSDHAYPQPAATKALNHALRRIAPENVRLHLCWGNFAGPHNRDVPLADILDIVLTARVGGIS